MLLATLCASLEADRREGGGGGGDDDGPSDGEDAAPFFFFDVCGATAAEATCPSEFVGALLRAWPTFGDDVPFVAISRGPAHRAAAAVLQPANAVTAGVASGATPSAEARMQVLLHLAVRLLVRGAAIVGGRAGQAARLVVRVLLALIAATADGGTADEGAGESGGEGRGGGRGMPDLPSTAEAPSPTVPVDAFIDAPLRALLALALPRTVAEVCDALDRPPVAPLSVGGPRRRRRDQCLGGRRRHRQWGWGWGWG